MATPIDPAIIDVDFSKQPEYTMGNLGSGDPRRMRSFGEVCRLVPESDWKAEAEKLVATNTGCSAMVTRIYDQKQEGSCHPPGSLVTMATGEVRPIEQVRNLEMVITAEGNMGEVRQTMARPYIGQLVGIHLHGHNLLRSTPEHPILTKRGYVAAEQLTADDWVAIPKVRPAEVKVLQTSGHLPLRNRCSNELRTRQFNAPMGRVRTAVTIVPVPDLLELDAKLGRIIGLFLAEGNIDKQKIVWTFNINERETLVDELRTLLEERLGVETKLRIAGTRSTAKVEMYGTLWARLFESLCSTGSGKKRLCPELASGPPEFLRAVFEGWMAGDGHKQERVNTGVTISRSLAVQMFQIATRFGMFPALRRSEPKASKSAAVRQPRYDLTFSPLEEPAECYRRQQDETHCWRKVRMLTREDYKGPVFNLHVHGDESYVVDGVGVHNCVANASCQAMEIVQGVQFGKDRVIQLSAISLYKRIGSSAQSGAYVGDGLEELAKRGALPLDTPENRERFGEKVMPNTGFREPYPQDWENTANYFRAVEWLEIKSLAELVSSLLTRFPVVVGREGHSICYCDYLPDGKVKYANSWGNWGENGFGYDTTNQVRKTISGGAWALRAVKTPEFQRAA